MKSFALIIFVAQAVILQSAYSQILRSSKVSLSGPLVGPVLNSPCGCSSPILSTPVLSPVVNAPCLTAPVVSSIVSPTVLAGPSVANSLADTLSLLTVSSLLADTLPLSYPGVVSTLPVLAGGCGCGCGGYGYSIL